MTATAFATTYGWWSEYAYRAKDRETRRCQLARARRPLCSKRTGDDLGVARRVYVIELASDVGRRRDPRIPWVYVGCSARSPEVRFEQHKRGYKSARLVKRFGERLRPDLYEDLSPVVGSDDAVAAERTRAIQLARAGFVAHCDGVSYGKRLGSWTEWGYRRLLRVSDHVDTAIAELVECTFRPPTLKMCAHLLWGTRGFWVDDLMDQSDPPPAFGLFAHVRRDALERRIDALVQAGELAIDRNCLYLAGTE